ncbi:ABC transporter substrate-binding protein [Gordonia sp. TBRC 11910]|uniref:ABC transporter substrate-binding protein n=2 Tax=Gordonia asplenii TaxID=2725283 RepID=A0A848L9B6_9ACTN|nr:ABC transporter substrate-binding protein [Gordonia asplenii]
MGVVSGCGDAGPPTVNYLVDARFSTYNANSVTGNSDGVLMAFTRVLPGFSFLGSSGQVIPDHDIGTATQVPGPSLTVRYDFNPKAVFSDGHAITCDDLYLSWAAQSGRFGGFAPATTAGYRDIADVACTAGARTATVTFAKGRDYRDWLGLFGAGTLLPSHVVARDAGVPDVVGPLRANNRAALAKIATAWNTGFTLRPGSPVDAARFLSSGPYVIDSLSATGGLVLKRNDKWWGDQAATERVTVWSTSSKPTDLPGGFDVVDIADGSVADRDGRSAADQLKPAQVTLADPRRALGVDEIVLRTSGVFADPAARQAFASCVPRDVLTRQFGRGAQQWNQRFGAPADTLAAAVNGEFGRRYQRADLARARELKGDRPLTVRMAYRGRDARSKAMVAVIADSCKQAGITVSDTASPTTTATDLGRSVDAMLLSSGVSFAATGAFDPTRSSYQLRGGDPLNIGDFRDPAVSDGVDQLAVATNSEDRLRLIRLIENAAWQGVASIPLFATPRQQGFAASMGNVVPSAARSGTGWNMDRWKVSTK